VAVKNDSINDDPAYLQFLSCPLIWRGYEKTINMLETVLKYKNIDLRCGDTEPLTGSVIGGS
jgi:hypothetical protein